jgi:hypothetical protein
MRDQRTCVGHNWTNAGWPVKCEGHAGRGGVISRCPHGLEMAVIAAVSVAVELLIASF